jgi:hypothetical protein
VDVELRFMVLLGWGLVFGSGLVLGWLVLQRGGCLNAEYSEKKKILVRGRTCICAETCEGSPVF